MFETGQTPPDARDRGDAVVLRWRGVDGTRRRLVFEPRSAGGYTRIEEEWRDGGWHTQGNEIVSEVAIEQQAEVLP